MNHSLLVVLLLAALHAPALAHDCEPPATACRAEPPRTVSTPAGESVVRWVQYVGINTPAGMVSWYMHRPVDLVECRWAATKIIAAAGRVAASISDPYAQFKIELKEAADACFPTPGTPREYEFLRLRWLGCEALRTNPPAGTPANWLPANHCGPAPTPPAQPTETWRATGSTIFTYTAGRLTGATARKAAVGAACDPVPQRVIVGSTTYLQLVGGATTERTACAKQ